MTYLSAIRAADSPSIDAFSRWRVSEPYTVFDAKQTFDKLPLLFDDQEVSGSGTSSSYSSDTASTTLGVSLNTAGRRVRQSFQRPNYQPGKSQLVLITGVLYAGGGGTGITRGMGLYDDSNGIFLKDDEGVIKIVRRSSVTGSPVDTEVIQNNWNLDPLDGSGPSGIDIEWDLSVIFVVDLEWLGVGRVRCGVCVDGVITYCHEMLHANVIGGVYMSTPNLPIRYEVENDGTGAASDIETICCSVMSEGGVQPNGVLRHASTGGTHIDATTENTVYALLGIRLKSAYIGTTIDLASVGVQLHTASHQCEWLLMWNPDVAGSFTYSGLTNSAIEVATGATANTVTNGYAMTGGWVESGGTAAGGAGSSGGSIPTTLRLGAAIDGTVDEIVLAVRPVNGSSAVDAEGSLSWREI